LTRQLVTSWARDEPKRATPLTWARRIEVVRPFAKHRARIEPGTYLPDADTFGRSRRRLAPYVYTDREVTDLLAAAGRLSPKGTLRPVTYRALFGLVAGTGLRVSEALRLQCSDVDLDAGMLTVRQTKFAKSRLVPLHSTTVRALKQYLVLRQRHLPTVQDGPFLASAKGTALAKRTVHWVFDRLRKQLGWTARGMPPRARRSAPLRLVEEAATDVRPAGDLGDRAAGRRAAAARRTHRRSRRACRSRRSRRHATSR